MENEIFKDRERANEAAYFRQQDAKLVESLRERASLEEIAAALRDKLQLDNPELLDRVRQLGLKPERAPALFLAPLVQVAWAEGTVTKEEHDTVLRLATERGIEPDSPPYVQLHDWLQQRPDDSVFDLAMEAMHYGLAVLTPAEREDRIKRLVEACHEVAAASGGGLGRLLGLSDGVSGVEASTLETITSTLRSAR